jgi:uncharacterized DUF497 family protein
MDYHFEWDPTKAQRNLAQHNISFRRATMVFRDPQMVSIFDEEHSQTEDRWITLGRDEYGIVLVVIHTFRQFEESSWVIRIISARKATQHEWAQYEEDML